MRRLFLLLLAVTAGGCGVTVHQPARAAAFEPNPTFELSDADIAKAFEARPQLPAEIQLAYYSFDEDNAERLGEMIAGLPTTRGVYRIPSMMMTGERRFSRRNYYGWTPPQPFSVKKLRLLAARAGCDAVVVFDYGYRFEGTANGLTAFTLLILPTFFLPFLDMEVESYLDAYLIDTRNGYLYAHVAADQKDVEEYEMIWSQAGDELVEAQWPKLLADTERELVRVLEDPSIRLGGVAPDEPTAEPDEPDEPTAEPDEPDEPAADNE